MRQSTRSGRSPGEVARRYQQRSGESSAANAGGAAAAAPTAVAAPPAPAAGPAALGQDDRRATREHASRRSALHPLHLSAAAAAAAVAASIHVFIIVEIVGGGRSSGSATPLRLVPWQRRKRGNYRRSWSGRGRGRHVLLGRGCPAGCAGRLRVSSAAGQRRLPRRGNGIHLLLLRRQRRGAWRRWRRWRRCCHRRRRVGGGAPAAPSDARLRRGLGGRRGVCRRRFRRHCY